MKAKEILFTILTAILAYVPIGARADILTGKAVDEKTGEPLAMASVKVETKMDGSTYISNYSTDSLGNFAVRSHHEGRTIVTVSMIGYHNAKKRTYCGSKSTADTIRLGEFRLKPSDVLLNEVVVSTKAKRFTMQGDTIVFNPAAFKLQEGARLKELIEKLPGVVQKDGKLYWNDKPLRLQMNGRDIFGGSGIVADLPAEAVQNIKSYNKATEFAKHTGKDDGNEDQVLDIKIKAGFMDKWYGDIRTSLQSPKGYQTSIKASRLSDRNPVMFSFDTNNINRYEKMGTNWMSNGDIDYFGKAQNASLGYQHNFKSGGKDNNYVAATSNFNHIDGWGTDYSAAQYFSPNNVTTWSLNRNSHYKHEITPKLSLDLYTYLTEKDFILSSLTFNYSQKRNNSESGSVRLDADTKPYGDFPLDLLLSAGASDAAYRHLINRERTYQQNIQEGTTTDFRVYWSHFLGKKGELVFNANLAYSNGNDRFSSHRELEYIRQNIASPLYQYSHSPHHNLTFSGYGLIKYNISDALLFQASQEFGIINDKVRKQSYRSDAESRIETDPESTTDEANSYRSRKQHTKGRTIASVTYKTGNWQFTPKMWLTLEQEKLDYQRGQLDTIANRNSTKFIPQMDVKWKMDKSNRLDFRFLYDTQLPDLLSTLNYRDDTDPFWIVEGNPRLHRSHSHSTSLTYTRTLDKQQAMMLFKVIYAYNIHPIATVYNFDPQTGIYRSHSENVKSGNTWYMEMVYDKSFGDYINLSTKAAANFSKSYGYLAAFDRNTVQEQNQMKVFSLNLDPKLSYERDWLQLELSGNINLQRNRYSLASQYNSTPIRYTYGLNATAKLKHWEFNTEIYDKAATGYLAPELNRHRLLWDTTIRYLLNKKKGWIGISFDDILNQKRDYSAIIDSSQHKEDWNESMHHFVKLTFNYHFDAKGKKE